MDQPVLQNHRGSAVDKSHDKQRKFGKVGRVFHVIETLAAMFPLDLSLLWCDISG